MPQTIRIGTLVPGQGDAGGYIRQILPHGFESFSLMFWRTLGDADLPRLADSCRDALAGSDAVISSLSVYGNALMDDAEAQAVRRGWECLIDAAPSFGCDLVTGFIGRIVDEPIEASFRCLTSPRCSGRSRRAPPTGACGWLSRTARRAATGVGAAGTSPTSRPPGS